MYRNNIFQPFEIRELVTDECPMEAHLHNFFELVFIVEGRGIQRVNENQFKYGPGHLFLLTPADSHSFTVEETTKFFFLRFTDIYIKELTDRKAWIQQMEFILHHAGHAPGCILHLSSDKPLVQHLVEALQREHNGESLYRQEIICQLVNTLISIVARNIALRLPASLPQQADRTFQDIVHYIQSNIYEPEKLKAEKMADQVGVSVNYLGRYFKKHAGKSMQDYIMQYKLKLVETRLLHSSMRINEIAWELNFADESHLTRLFKKHNGVNPSAFRKQKMKVEFSNC